MTRKYLIHKLPVVQSFQASTKDELESDSAPCLHLINIKNAAKWKFGQLAPFGTTKLNFQDTSNPR